MSKVFAAFSFLLCTASYAQISGHVINKVTKEAIPFANIWVLSQNIGTSSNEAGKFHLNASETDSIVISALGFSRKIIPFDTTLNHTIELLPSVVELNEFQVQPNEQNKLILVDEFSKKGFSHYFGCGAKPWIIAKFFEYDMAYSDTPFLKDITFLTDSDVKNAQFNIRLYHVNDAGAPGRPVYHHNLLATAKKGKKMTEVDISTLGIRFPENGLFVAVEWLIIPENKYDFKYVTDTWEEEKLGSSYEPAFGAERTSTNANSWKYQLGNGNRLFIPSVPILAQKRCLLPSLFS